MRIHYLCISECRDVEIVKVSCSNLRIPCSQHGGPWVPLTFKAKKVWNSGGRGGGGIPCAVAGDILKLLEGEGESETDH